MKQSFFSLVDGLSYLFLGGDEKEHDAIPFKEKLRVVFIWTIGITFCVTMLKLLLP